MTLVMITDGLGRPRRRSKMIKLYSRLDALFFGHVICIQLTRDGARQRVVQNESAGFTKNNAFL